MMNTAIIKRIIVCVDGAWYDSEGQLEKETGNNSNIYRLWATIKHGTITDTHGKQIEQICKYFGGIGPKKPSGISRSAFEKRTEDVVNYCYNNTQSPDDELWLFGFSQGAAIILHAVAELLQNTGSSLDHHDDSFQIETPKSRSRDSWSKRLLFRRKLPNNPKSERGMQLTATIKLIGLFDAVNGLKIEELGESVLSDQIQQIRHALALNEDQKDLSPILMGGKDYLGKSNRESLIEAWFVGTHMDIGGGTKLDGLSLYPLQWMMIESRNLGLHFYEPGSVSSAMRIAELAFPSQGLVRLTSSLEDTEQDNLNHDKWDFTYSNGITAQMFDLRVSHGHGNIQKPPSATLTKSRNLLKPTKNDKEPSLDRNYASASPPRRNRRSLMLPRRGPLDNQQEESREPASKDDPYRETMTAQHYVKVNKTSSVIRTNFLTAVTGQSQPRGIFQIGSNGDLVGYYDRAACGNVIHPSVYFLIYAYPWIEEAVQRSREEKRNLERFRKSRLPIRTFDPWITEYGMETKKACRILVCGATGVGKSTLLNNVFGIPIANVSRSKRGIHDINIALESDRHPGIIIHDSRGFESGATKEVELVKDFISKRLHTTEQAEQLDAIWLCVLSTTYRRFQDAEEKLLEELKKHKSDIPVVVVCTMKDRFIDEHENRARNNIRKTRAESGLTPLDEPTLTSQAVAQANADLLKDKKEAEKKVHKDLNTHAKIVYTATNDPHSIQQLIKETLQQVRKRRPQASVPLAGAQVLSAKQKIRQAIEESVRFLRQDKNSWQRMANVIGFIPLGDSTVTPILSRILCDKIVKCFGFPNIKPNNVADIMTSVIFRNLAKFLPQSMGTDIWNWGTVAVSLFIWVGPPALKIWPAARMIIKCACDLIIILDRAFVSEGMETNYEDIKLAMREYMSRKDAKGNTKVSKRAKVHEAIQARFPMKKRPLNMILVNPRRTRKYIKKIIKKFRFGPEDGKSSIDQNADVENQPDASDDSSFFAEERAAMQQMTDTYNGSSSNASQLSDDSQSIDTEQASINSPTTKPDSQPIKSSSQPASGGNASRKKSSNADPDSDSDSQTDLDSDFDSDRDSGFDDAGSGYASLNM